MMFIAINDLNLASDLIFFGATSIQPFADGEPTSREVSRYHGEVFDFRG